MWSFTPEIVSKSSMPAGEEGVTEGVESGSGTYTGGEEGDLNDMIITSKVVLDAMRGRPPTAPSALGRRNLSEHPFGRFSCPFSSDKP